MCPLRQCADHPAGGRGYAGPRALLSSTHTRIHTHIHTCTHRFLISLPHRTPSLSRIIQTSWQRLGRVTHRFPPVTLRTDWWDQKRTETVGGTTKRQLLSHSSPPHLPPLVSLVSPETSLSAAFSSLASAASSGVNEKAAGGSRRRSRFIFMFALQTPNVGFPSGFVFWRKSAKLFRIIIQHFDPFSKKKNN